MDTGAMTKLEMRPHPRASTKTLMSDRHWLSSTPSAALSCTVCVCVGGVCGYTVSTTWMTHYSRLQQKRPTDTSKRDLQTLTKETYSEHHIK